jgi:hypothetical protein
MSIARIPILKSGNQGGSIDITYNLILTYVFTVLEPMLAIICACVPVLQNLLRGGAKTGFGIFSLYSLLRTGTTQKSTQDGSKMHSTAHASSKNNWSRIKASGGSSGQVSGNYDGSRSMEMPLRPGDEEMGRGVGNYYEMNEAGIKKTVKIEQHSQH